MKVRRIASDVRWAFRETIRETEVDVGNEEYKRLCDHCQVINGPNCPRKSQLRKEHENMIATICVYFRPHPQN
jgi:hypothetical protein